MPNWNGVPIPEPLQVKIPNSIPQNFNWNSYLADPKGTFNKFKGPREVHRLNWKGYLTASRNTKKVILSSPSKKVFNAAVKQIKTLRQARKVAENAKKIAENGKKVQDAILKNIPGANDVAKGGKAGSLLGGLLVIGGVALLIAIKAKFEEFLQDKTYAYLDSLNNDLTKTNQLTVQVGLKVKEIEKDITSLNKELDANAKDYARLNKQAEKNEQDITATKKQANEALYETRQGREIVERKVADVKKQANDALYETREGRKIVEGKIADALSETRANKQNLEGQLTGLRNSFDTKIQSINAAISKFNNNASETFQKAINSTISKIQSDLATTRSKVDAIRPQTPTDTASINANAVAAARALVTPLQSQVTQLSGTVGSLQGQVAQIPVLAGAVGSLAQQLNNVNGKADAAMNEAKNKGVPNLGPIQQQLDDKFNKLIADNNKALGIKGLEMSSLFKEFEQRNKDFQRQSNLTADQRYQEFVKENIKTLTATDLKLSDLSKEFDRRNAEFFAQSTKTSQEIYEGFIEQNKAALNPIKSDITNAKSDIVTIKSDLKTTRADLTKIDTKLKEKLLQSGLVQKLVVRSVEGTTKFTSRMLCTVAKRATVEDALKDKIISTDNTKLSGSKITGLVTPLRATFY